MKIRPATADDAADVQAIYAPEVIETPITFEIEPPTVEEMRTRIAATMTLHPWVVCDGDGGVRGYAYATAHRSRAAYRWSADVSVYVHREARGAGIGRALYTTLLALLPLQGFRNVYAGITLPNAGSVRLHESMRFAPVGVYRAVGYKLGAWHDVGWWELALGPRAAAPAEPRPWRDVEALPALELGSALLR